MSLCNSCGHEQASTAVNANEERAFKFTPVSFCGLYFIFFLVIFGLILFPTMFISFGLMIRIPPFYLKVFADSFSVSNASNANATADWTIGLITKSPSEVISLHTIKSRLFRGNKLISETPSSTPDYYFRLNVTGNITEQPLPYTVFKAVETPRNGVVWDLRVEILATTSKIKYFNKGGLLTVICDGFPVNFTADSTGDVKGSLVGLMRPCEYLFRHESSF